MKKWLIGQQPSRNVPSQALSADDPSWAGFRLASLCDMTPDQYHKAFERRNVNYLTEGQFKVDSLSRIRAFKLSKGFESGDIVIMMGRAVCSCFGLPSDRLFQFYPTEQGWLYAVMPHPSSRNRWWNIEENVEYAKEFMSAVVAYDGADG